MAAKTPVLWHLALSHYSEKARWALDYKRIEHERKGPPPGAHMAIALAKSRGSGKTFPLLDLDGRTYADSTEIIAALEQRFGEPSLYPQDPGERRRALELEDWFDERVGPYSRRLVWHEVVRDPEGIPTLIRSGLMGPIRATNRASRAAVAGFLQLRFGVKSEQGAEEARRQVLAGFERIEAELDGGEYLVGDRFGVADLTAASLLYPIVLPAEGPPIPRPLPAAVEELRGSLADRPGFRWVEEMFRRHRARGAARAPSASAV